MPDLNAPDTSGAANASVLPVSQPGSKENDMPDGIADILAMFRCDPYGSISSWNKDCEAIFGYKKDEVIGKNINILYIPEAVKNNEPEKNLQNALVFANYRTEGWRVKKDGTLFIADVYYTALFDNENKLTGYAKITRETDNKTLNNKNIDKLKPIKDLITSGEQITNDKRFRKIIENSYEGISLLNKDLNVIFRSHSAERIGGWDNAERVKHSMLDLIHKDDLEKVKAHLNEVLQNAGQPRAIIYQTRHFNGHYVWIDSVFTNFLNDNDINAIVCNYRNITEEVQAKELLANNNKYFKALAENSSDAIIIFNQENKPVYLSPGFHRILGYSIDDVLTMDPFSIIHPDDVENVKFNIYRCLVTPGILIQFEYRMKNKQGEWLNLDSKFFNLLDDPAIGVLVHNFSDITEKKRNEQTILESEKKYKLLFENNPLPIIIWDFKTLQIIDCNEAAALKYQYSKDELRQLSIKNIRPEEDISLVEEITRSEEVYGQKNKKVWRHKNKNGGIILLDITTNLMTLNGRTVAVSISNDITESLYYHELERLEREILEMNAFSDVSLTEAISVYLEGIEKIHPGTICSMQEKKGSRLYNLTSPNLPEGFLQAIEGIEIRINAGSCGTAAFLKEKVIVTDIQNDTRWADYKEIAALNGLKACWSSPVLNKNGEVMATFATYYKQTKAPTGLEENTIQRAVHILQVILESYNREQALKRSNERFEYATEATSDIIWDWDLETNGVYYSRNINKLFGHTAGINYNNLPFYWEHVHPDDRERVVNYPDQIKYGQMKTWVQDYRFKKADGEYAFVRDKGIVIRNKNGLGIRMVGAMQDITKQKREEQHLKLMESVVTNANDSVLITEAEPFDLPGPRILYVNDAFSKMTGYLPGEVIGKSPRILQGPKTDQNELRRLGNALRNWQPCEATLINYKKNGEEFWINFSLAPVADEKGWFTHWISIERDVTQKKNEELQKSLIAEISQVFNSPGGLKYSLGKAIEKIGRYSNFGMAEFWLIDADKKNINLVTSFIGSEKLKDYGARSFKYNGVVKGEGIIGNAWETKQTQYWHFRQNTISPLKRIDEIIAAGIKTTYALPLIYNEEVIGVLIFNSEKDEALSVKVSDLFENFNKIFAAEIKRKQIEEEVNQIFTFAPDILCISGPDGYFKKVNPAMCSLLEYNEEELLSAPFMDFVHPLDKVKTIEELSSVFQNAPSPYFENRYITRSGKIKWLAWTSSPTSEEGLVYSVAKDITEKKKLENLLDKATSLARIGGWEVDLKRDMVYWSDMTKEIHETPADFKPDLKNAINFYKEGNDRDIIVNVMEQAARYGIPADIELQIITARHNLKWVRVIIETEFLNGKCLRLYGSFQDIDARKKIELALAASFEEKKVILDSIDDAFFTVDRNWEVTYWNKMAAKLLGKPSNQMLGNNLWDVFSEAVDTVSYKNYHQVMQSNVANHFEDFYAVLNKWFEISVYPSELGLSVYFKDVTGRKESERKLEELNENLQKQAKELSISNAELEQFAYVASHDLQEPLRMVTSFLTQIERKYNHILDDKGKQYIHFAVDGAKRMRQIILDLLEFSRVGRADDDAERIDLNILINDVLALYRKKIQEKSAKVYFKNLPVVQTYKTPLREILQNLISNGLKYQKPGNAPIINIGCEENTDHWLIFVQDNGIGIDPVYFDKIFIIFQRLHNKDEFSGTGMGLAITKKIVENLGGRIWVESEEGKGSTFYFTILKNAKQ